MEVLTNSLRFCTEMFLNFLQFGNWWDVSFQNQQQPAGREELDLEVLKVVEVITKMKPLL